MDHLSPAKPFLLTLFERNHLAIALHTFISNLEKADAALYRDVITAEQLKRMRELLDRLEVTEAEFAEYMKPGEKH